MKNILKRSLALVMLTLLIGLNSVNVFAGVKTTIEKGKEKGEEKSIVDIATSDARFTTLVKALQAADLVDTLKNDGQFTVFAPTDEAFQKLGADKLNELLKPENKEALKDILFYHVARKEILADKVVKLNGKELNMLNNKKAKIEVKNNEAYIDGAKIIITDIRAKNGIIHVIDAVMVP